MGRKWILEPDGPLGHGGSTLAWSVCYALPKAVLPLVDALAGAGLTADCPTLSFRRRQPRRNRTELITKPLIGGMFFLASPWEEARARLVRLPAGESVRRMRTPAGAVVILTAEQMDALREAGARASEHSSTLVVGDYVEIGYGPLRGMKGFTLRVGPLVRMDVEGMPGKIEIAACLLRKVQA